MRYISDDGKVFNTEQECLEHENSEKRKAEELLKKEQFEVERKQLLKEINDEYKVLQKKLREYAEKTGMKQRFSFVPFYDIMDMLCR